MNKLDIYVYKQRRVMRSQKEAVCGLLLQVLSERGVEFEQNGPVNMKDVLTPADKKTVREQVTIGFLEGEISMSEQAQAKYLGDPKELSKYVHGLVNNWIKKCPQFNNGMKYIPENPGSRTGQGDDQIKAMRGLKKTTSDPLALAEIDKAIAARIAEIKPANTVTIIVEHLPEHLRHLVE